MSNKIRNLTERNQFERKKNKERKVEPSEIPKLSLSNLQQNQGGSGQVGGYRGGGGGGSGYNYHEESPPLHKRDVDKVDKGYPIINETKTSHNSHSHSHNNNNNNNNSNKFNSSGKYPPLAKTSEYFSESFQDDVNYIVRSRENRDQRKMGSKLPPRDLKPINHVPNTLNDKLQMDQHHHHQHHQGGLIPGHKLQSQRLPSLSRSHGPGALQSLNPMLKSSSLSKIEQDEPINKHILESSHQLINQNKKSLAPLNHSNRNLQPVQSTRPW